MGPPAPLAATALVAFGGGLGAVLRYHFGRLVLHALGPVAATAFPWATLGVNLIGGLAMGLLAGWLARHGAIGGAGGEAWRLALGVGVLGGFTTFSAFTLELVLLTGRGDWAAAAAYATLSLLGAPLALVLGLWTMRA
jgi:fluoride exporter